jgi:ATP dependent DNA ligase-like protein
VTAHDGQSGFFFVGLSILPSHHLLFRSLYCAHKSGGKVQLRSRNDNDFTERFSSIAAALRSMPDETVLDGEAAALNEEGRPSFNLLQNLLSDGGFAL